MSRSESRPNGADETRDDFPYDEFADVTTELALALPPVTPSPDLKARLMAQIAQTPQLPAAEADAPATEEPAPTAGLAPVTPLAPQATPAADAPLASLMRPRPTDRACPTPPAAARGRRSQRPRRS